MNDTAKTFILKELQEVCSDFPSIKAKFQYDAESASYFIEILPNQEFTNNRELKKRMSKITKQFVKDFRTESICWLSEDDLIEIENPEVVITGNLYEDKRPLIKADSIIPSFEQYIPEINENRLEHLLNFKSKLKNIYWENVLSTSLINCSIYNMGQAIQGWHRHDFASWLTFQSHFYTNAQAVFRFDNDKINKLTHLNKLVWDRGIGVVNEPVGDYLQSYSTVISSLTLQEEIEDQQNEENIIDDFNYQAA